jgi:isocitrate/isopropylmalate dehydrogenase
MTTHRTAVIRGDSIGPQVTRKSEKVLGFVGEHDVGIRFELGAATTEHIGDAMTRRSRTSPIREEMSSRMTPSHVR